jgi:hypothetical protein
MCKGVVLRSQALVWVVSRCLMAAVRCRMVSTEKQGYHPLRAVFGGCLCAVVDLERLGLVVRGQCWVQCRLGRLATACWLYWVGRQTAGAFWAC